MMPSRLILAVLLFLELAGLSLAQPSRPVAGEAAFIAGRVQATLAGVQRELRVGDAIFEGDTLLTGVGGHLHIRTIDNGFLALRPASRARVDIYDYKAAEPGATRIRIVLESGVVRAVSGVGAEASRDKFRLNTPVAAIGIRGTDFTVSTTDLLTRAVVQKGAIVVSAFDAACRPDGLGPCAGSAVRALSGDDAGKLLELGRGQREPKLIDVRSNSGAPDQVAPPAPSEPKASSAPDRTVQSSSSVSVAAPASVSSNASLSAGAPSASGAVSPGSTVAPVSTLTTGAVAVSGQILQQAATIATEARLKEQLGAAEADAAAARSAASVAAAAAVEAVNNATVSVTSGSSPSAGAGNATLAAAGSSATSAGASSADSTSAAASTGSGSQSSGSSGLANNPSNVTDSTPVVVPVVPAEPTVTWGRWAAFASQPAPVKVDDFVTQNGQLYAMNSLYVLAVNNVDRFNLPQSGQFDFKLQSAEAFATVAGVAVAPASVNGGALSVNFGKQSFATNLSVDAFGSTYAMVSQGQLTADGKLIGSPLFIDRVTNMNLRGALGGAQGTTAAYLFDYMLDPGRGIVGATNWAR